MYFPYVRGRQYELLALRELCEQKILGNFVIPIVEPVKLSPTLIKTMAVFVNADQPLSVIRNPTVGNFLKDLKDVEIGTKEDTCKEEFDNLYNESAIINSIIMQPNVKSILEHWSRMSVDNSDILVIQPHREYLALYEQLFSKAAPRFALIPDESAYRRRIRQNKVLLEDKFEKQSRNADYQKQEDEFFSDAHLYYKEDGFIGFSDYSVVGNEYLEAGFAPYAVAIHIVYFAEDKSLRVKHFVSDSNEDITDPARKFYEAVIKLADWYYENPHPVQLTLGLKSFLEHYRLQTYPGLGTVKKLSLMHHIELMGKYLSEVD